MDSLDTGTIPAGERQAGPQTGEVHGVSGAGLLPATTHTPFIDDVYHSPQHETGWFFRLFPALGFYSRMAKIVYTASRRADAGDYTGADWAASSLAILRAMEATGGALVLEGFDAVRSLAEPCLFVGNHMSSLETFVLPSIIRPYKPVTFVIKESLQTYPVFGSIMRSCDPITVGRANPRDDLSAVLDGGMERLKKGISIVIFPQSTRAEVFDPSQFNTIGIKLARKAKVPIIPMALRTLFWGNGSLLKDFGPVRPRSIAHIRFGEPLTVEGNGKQEHERISAFIQASLAEWEAEEAARVAAS